VVSRPAACVLTIFQMPVRLALIIRCVRADQKGIRLVYASTRIMTHPPRSRFLVTVVAPDAEGGSDSRPGWVFVGQHPLLAPTQERG
jgi:hypothetical protein